MTSPEALPEGLAEALRTFFAELADAYAAGDVDAIAARFALPLMLVTGDGTVFVEDEAALAAMLDGVLAGWRADRVVRAVPVLGEVLPLPDDAARATVEWTRLDAAGGVVLRFTAIYTLAEEDGEWSIVVLDAADETRARAAIN